MEQELGLCDERSFRMSVKTSKNEVKNLTFEKPVSIEYKRRNIGYRIV